MKRIIVITGGSQGIGEATAYQAASKGYTVCINYRQNQEAANKVVDKIISNGGEAFAISADVSQEAEVIRLFELIDEKEGIITALVNNAGILEQQTTIHGIDANRLNRVFATNVIGSFICAREAIKRMSINNKGIGGGIVNLSSVAARLGAPGEYLDYAASKGAIDSMTVGLAKEVADEHIRVNAVRPGLILTDLHAKGGEPNRPERLKSTIPLKRSGHPEEVAKAIMWLLSEEASYITGAIIDVTGGR